MRKDYIEDMVRRLKPVLKDKSRAKIILTRYWQNKIVLVWETKAVHRAANEVEVALTEKEAMSILETLHRQHNPQYGIKWEDITTHIQENVLGRKLNQREVRQFVHHDRLTIQG